MLLPDRIGFGLPAPPLDRPGGIAPGIGLLEVADARARQGRMCAQPAQQPPRRPLRVRILALNSLLAPALRHPASQHIAHRRVEPGDVGDNSGEPRLVSPDRRNGVVARDAVPPDDIAPLAAEIVRVHIERDPGGQLVAVALEDRARFGVELVEGSLQRAGSAGHRFGFGLFGFGFGSSGRPSIRGREAAVLFSGSGLLAHRNVPCHTAVTRGINISLRDVPLFPGDDDLRPVPVFCNKKFPIEYARGRTVRTFGMVNHDDRQETEQSTERPVVSLRLAAGDYEEKMTRGRRKRLRLAEEVARYRLEHYDELVSFRNEVDDARLGAMLNTRDDDMIDRLAERIAKARKIKNKPE